MRTVVRTPEQLAEVASYGAGLEVPLEGELRRYVTFFKEDPADGLVAMMNRWDVVGNGPSKGTVTGARRISWH